MRGWGSSAINIAKKILDGDRWHCFGRLGCLICMRRLQEQHCMQAKFFSDCKAIGG